jgi:beta-keto acid cleavage enzyme
VIADVAYRAWHTAVYLGPCSLGKRKEECPLFVSVCWLHSRSILPLPILTLAIVLDCTISKSKSVMEKLIIFAALGYPGSRDASLPAVPSSWEDLVESAVAAGAAGASIVHFHGPHDAA